MDFYDMMLSEKLSGGGGGGGSSWTLLHEEDVTVSTTSTSLINVKTINVAGAYTSDLLCAVITDNAGARNGYFYKCITLIANINAANESASAFATVGNICINKAGDGNWGIVSGTSGVLLGEVEPDDDIVIKARYNSSNTRTINGTYHIAIYKMTLPDGKASPFE